MRQRIMGFFFLIIFIFAQVSLGYASDWKACHEKAHGQTLTQALSDVVKNPKSLDSLYVLGLVNLALYKIDDANVVFHDMLTLDSKSTEAQWGIAEVLYRRHKGAEARTILIELIKATPNYSPAYITLGYVLFNEKKYDEAIELAVRVLKQGPKKVDNDNYVQALLLAGNSKGMIAVDGGPFSKLINGIQVLPYLNKAQKLQPDNAGVAFGLGTYYLLAPSFAGGDKHKALEYLEKSVKLDPQFCDGYARLAQAYKLKGDDVKYDFYIGKALELDPQNGLALDIKKEMSS